MRGLVGAAGYSAYLSAAAVVASVGLMVTLMATGALNPGQPDALAARRASRRGRDLRAHPCRAGPPPAVGANRPGAAAGLVGGLLFTLVMLQIGFLPTVARLVGSDSELVGFVVHLVIAEVVGAFYGVLFRRQAFDPSAGIGWGVSYGFVWWILGPLTLAPVILGATPAWSVEAMRWRYEGATNNRGCSLR